MSDTFHPITRKLITAYAKTASPGNPADLAAVMESRVRETKTGFTVHDKAGNILVNRDGSNADLGDLVAALKASSPALFDLGTVPAAAPAGVAVPAPSKPQSLTEQWIAENKRRREEQKVEAAPMANPWLAATRNFTWQMIVEKRDPALASRLKAEAGVRE